MENRMIGHLHLTHQDDSGAVFESFMEPFLSCSLAVADWESMGSPRVVKVQVIGPLGPALSEA